MNTKQMKELMRLVPKKDMSSCRRYFNQIRKEFPNLDNWAMATMCASFFALGWDKGKKSRTQKTESFASLRKSGRFAKTSLNDMRKAGREARKALE
jgi:hypothetical protein